MRPVLTTAVESSSQNAWRHGMYARKLLLHNETGDQFETLRGALVDQWRPRNVTEWFIVDQLAKQQWRLLRASDAETDQLRERAEEPEYPNPNKADRLAAVALGRDVAAADSGMTRLQHYQLRLERSILRLIGQLVALKKRRRKLGGLQRR